MVATLLCPQMRRWRLGEVRILAHKEEELEHKKSCHKTPGLMCYSILQGLTSYGGKAGVGHEFTVSSLGQHCFKLTAPNFWTSFGTVIHMSSGQSVASGTGTCGCQHMRQECGTPLPQHLPTPPPRRRPAPHCQWPSMTQQQTLLDNEP